MRISDWSSDVCSSDLLELYKDVARAKKFMTNGEYNRIRSRLNEPACGIIEFNKWIFATYCESLGIPTPHCYGVFHREFAVDESEKPLRDLLSLLCFLESVCGAILAQLLSRPDEHPADTQP